MKRSYWLLAFASLGYGCDTPQPTALDHAVAPGAAASPEQRQFAQEIVIDYVAPHQHAGPGPHPSVESDRFALLSGGIRWFNGGTVEYRITGTAPSGGNVAVVSGVQAWDALISQRAFAHDDGTSQVNPCTGQPNTISWTNIDGPGGTLGATAPCYELLSKEIVGFSVILDNGESWGTSGGATVFDVANVMTHEFGHAVGLGHVNAPRDGCLTMYRFAIQGEIQKRTPGLGDKLGMAALYGNTDLSAGSCGS
jgi:hypothetical protein